MYALNSVVRESDIHAMALKKAFQPFLEFSPATETLDSPIDYPNPFIAQMSIDHLDVK
jgi:hypothetical protein